MVIRGVINSPLGLDHIGPTLEALGHRGITFNGERLPLMVTNGTEMLFTRTNIHTIGSVCGKSMYF